MQRVGQLIAHETLRRLADAFYREAVAAALAGDLRNARLVLDDASSAGCSPYQIAVLNGLIALNEGDYHGAITFAEEAIATARSVRDAQGVAATALLTAASYLAGDDDRWEGSVVDLQSLTPQSETDQLLKTSVVVLWDPAEAVSLLDKESRMGSSPAGLFIRANARFLMATDRQDATMMDNAVQDYEYVNYFYRDLPSPLSWGTQAMAAAIEIAKVQQRPDEVERYKEQGRRLAEKLTLITAAKAYPPGDYSRWLFYRACGDLDAASSAIRRVGRMPGSYSLFLAADCIQRYDVAKAAQEFDNATRHTDKASNSYEGWREHMCCVACPTVLNVHETWWKKYWMTIHRDSLYDTHCLLSALWPVRPRSNNALARHSRLSQRKPTFPVVCLVMRHV